MTKKNTFYWILLALTPICISLAVWLLLPEFSRGEDLKSPSTLSLDLLPAGQEKPCKEDNPEWRQAQQIDGVKIAESLSCNPDNPYAVASFVKGMNNISMKTLMNTRLSEDTLTKSDDLDGDGDPDIIRIKLEVVELNGATPDGEFKFMTYDIAPGLQPAIWVFSPKMRGMSVKNFLSKQATALLRAPSPSIRIEQGDKVYITLENTHYFPHTLHFHGVDHSFQTVDGGDNDGVPMTGAMAIFPGSQRTYELQPRQTGTMLYHCHVQTDKHFLMGLNGMFIVEENRPNNWVQTFNIGAGKVRHASVASLEEYDQEYDLHYQAIDKKLAETVQHNDPRLIAQQMNRVYNMTESNENYFLLNGHSFPYTLRDSLLIAEPDQNIKLRIANAQHSNIAIHFHGHKATITHYDGIEAPAGAKITRDVFNVGAAQRIDVHLQTKNDGLHSYGEGIWLFHDHVETGVSSDGMSPGGNVSVLAYKSFLGESGLPKVRAEAVNGVFDRNYYAKQKPVWGASDFAKSLGEAKLLSPNYLKLVGFGLLMGLGLGLGFIGIRGLKKAT